MSAFDAKYRDRNSVVKSKSSRTNSRSLAISADLSAIADIAGVRRTETTARPVDLAAINPAGSLPVENYFDSHIIPRMTAGRNLETQPRGQSTDMQYESLSFEILMYLRGILRTKRNSATSFSLLQLCKNT